MLGSARYKIVCWVILLDKAPRFLYTVVAERSQKGQQAPKYWPDLRAFYPRPCDARALDVRETLSVVCCVLKRASHVEMRSLPAQPALRLRRTALRNMTAINDQVYFANALFTDGQRRYNAHLAKRLRAAGHNVFLAQEAVINDQVSPTADEIFRVDSAAILNSRVLVASLDQETIDSGVACEIGLAYAFNIPIIGLYTDIRQHRHGRAQMYKNLYVLGAIETLGRVATGIDELLEILPEFLFEPPDAIDDKAICEIYDSSALNYTDFVKELEGWYEPAWDVRSAVDRFIESTNPVRILEVGCGPGNLGAHICSKFPATTYVGYDKSQAMIEVAMSHNQPGRARFTCDATVFEEALGTPFDVILVVFSLHDHADREGTIATLSSCVRSEGHILIIDLSSNDLPELTRSLQRALARPAAIPDRRIDATWLAQVGRKHDLDVLQCELALPSVSFPSLDAMDRYMGRFGIYSGMDLPLGIARGEGDMWREHILNALSNQSFPFMDQRAFVICVLKKK